jgi:hypothetical protein
MYEGNKITKEFLESVIKGVQYLENGKTTIAILELNNGFQVIGTASVVDEDNFHPEIGERIAYEDAFEKLWELYGFVLQYMRWAHPGTPIK